MDKSQSRIKLEKLLKDKDLNLVEADVKSYIYQCLLEFEPYSTPDTHIHVIAKDPLQLIDNTVDGRGEAQLKKMFRIAIVMSEDGTKIEAEAVHENIFEAIKEAKDKLLLQLVEIHDSVVTAQDRHMEILNALTSGQVH